jgi:hypothetical protein
MVTLGYVVGFGVVLVGLLVVVAAVLVDHFQLRADSSRLGRTGFVVVLVGLGIAAVDAAWQQFSPTLLNH